jgi:hypothetical protein
VHEGVEEFFFFGLGEQRPARQHIRFLRKENELLWGETILTPGSGAATTKQSLSTGQAALVTRVHVDYVGSAQPELYLQETLPGSAVSSDSWPPREHTRREVHELPGEPGRSGIYDVKLLVGAWSEVSSNLSNNQSIAPFAPESSAALLVEWHPKST